MKKWFIVATTLFIVGVSVGIWRSVPRAGTSQERALIDIQNAQTQCVDEADRTKFIVCFRKLLASGIRAVGGKPYMDALDRVKTIQYKGTNRCHDVAHAIGQLGVIAKKGAIPDVSFCSTSLCGDGCYHGAMEGLVAQGKEIGGWVDSACSAATSTNARSRWACLHGLGHGLASVVVDVTKSLALCDRIATDDDKKNCGAGVLMELYQSPSIEHEKFSIPSGDVVLFCSSLKDPYNQVCSQNAGVYVYEQSHSIQTSGATCRRLPISDQDACGMTLGGYLFNQFISTAKNIVAVCEQLPQGLSDACLHGAVQESVFSDEGGKGAQQICDLTTTDKHACYSYIGDRAQEAYGQDGKKRLCDSLPEQVRLWCLGENQ